MPGVTVDQDGNISVAGKSGVIVLVDGRPSPLATANLNAFLKSVPANAIEAIELITKPSARYQAEGNAGIINIKMKKGRADGLNVSATASYGTIARTNDNVVFNYRKNKLNVFGTYALSYVENQTRYIEKRKIILDSISYYNMDSPSDRKNQNHTAKAGFDYFINEKNTLTYTSNFNAAFEHEFSDSRSNFQKTENVIDQAFNSLLNAYGKDYTITNDIAYRKTYDTTEREFSMSLTHSYLSSNKISKLNSESSDGLGNPLESNNLSRNSYTKGNINNIIFQFDYTHTLSLPGHKIETGLRNETTFNLNNFDVFNEVNQTEIPDSLLTNKFDYTENVNAFYVTYGATIKEMFSLNVGLRAEHTFIKSNTGSVGRNYISFFPSASMGVAFSEMQSLSVAYTRRIDRPGFTQINNAVQYYDAYTSWQGNPFLRPAFFDNVSIDYSLMVKQHIINAEVGGNFSTDEYTETSFLDTDTKLSRGGVVNGTKGKQFYFELYTKFKLTKWWDIQSNHVLNYSYYNYQEGLNKAPAKGVSYNLWASSVFKFWKNMSIDINGWFNVGGVSFQGRSKAVGVLNASVRKTFFKDKLAVALSGNNILQTMKWRWNTENSNLYTDGSWQSFNRSVFLSVTYMFGKNNNALKREDDKSNSRLSGGGGNR
jgi:iron complex outermembrane recepter protein